MSFHTVIFVGNLGRDPDAKYTPDGQMVCNFSVAVNDDSKSASGEKIERTIWIRVSTWGKQAENCNQYLKKGKKVLVEGKLVTDKNTGGPRVWEKQDGTAAASYEVRAFTVRFLSAAGEAGSAPANDVPEEHSSAQDESDMPF